MRIQIKRLRRLFSTNVIVRHAGGRKLKNCSIPIEFNKCQKIILLIDIQDYIVI